MLSQAGATVNAVARARRIGRFRSADSPGARETARRIHQLVAIGSCPKLNRKSVGHWAGGSARRSVSGAGWG